jgi:hypothetical protein
VVARVFGGLAFGRRASGLPKNFLCECSDTACVETVELRISVYQEVRANPIRFVIKPGHEIEAIERVVAEDGGYAVVEKHKAEADLIDMDPRSGTGC